MQLKKLKYLTLKHYISNNWLLWIMRFVVALFIYIFFLESNLLYITGPVPTLHEIKNPAVAIASDIYTSDSVLIGRYYIENRTPVAYNEMSPWLTKALVATEDARFYQHHGLDLYALVSSLWQTAQGDQRGGSTITQQLVKNIFKTRAVASQGLLRHVPGVRTLVYKTKEWLTALKLEFFFSKQDILELYLNSVDFGNNWFGVKVASNNYFNKSPLQLQAQEAAVLIGMLKATTTYNPKRNKEKSRQRRNIVLAQMAKYNYITTQQSDSLQLLPLKLNLRKQKKSESDDSYIRQYVEKTITPWCEQNNINLYEDGLKIYTTIHSKMQRNAEEAVSTHVQKLQKQFNEQWRNKNPWIDDNGVVIENFIEQQLEQTTAYADLMNQHKNNKDTVNKFIRLRKPMKIFSWKGAIDTTFSSYDSLKYYATIIQSGLMCWNPSTGKILAYVGGIDHQFFKYDKVTQSKRQPGSTFKPFAYLAAIDKGCDPCDAFEDKPVLIKYDNGQTWQPRNSDGVFTYTYKTLRRAMAQSCNSITAQITEMIGWQAVADYAKLCGISSDLTVVPSICLGSSDVGVYELANAYGTMVNDGNKCTPIIIQSICNKLGNTIATFKPQFTKVISDETSYLMRHMLLGSIEEPEGTSLALWSYKLFDNQNQIGGKTGTTSNNSDAWYVGITKNTVTTVWTGTDYRSIHLRGDAGQGSRAALPIFAMFMEKTIAQKNANIEIGRWPKPKEKINRQYLSCTGFIYNVNDSALTDSTGAILITDSMPVLEMPHDSVID